MNKKLVALTLTLLACNSTRGEEDKPHVDLAPGVTGEMLYVEPYADGNSFACGTCHSLEEPSADGVRRPGHSIGDAFKRPSFKNGKVTSLLEAVNTCRQEWMGAPPFESDDPRWARLQEFLASKAGTKPAAPLHFDIGTPPTYLDGGDKDRGGALFDRSCAVCHGAGARGTVRAPSLAGKRLNGALIASRIRTGGSTESKVYPGLSGGRMPFWATDRVSNAELRDLVAFVLNNDPAEEPTAAPTSDQPLRKCAATHPMVGREATLKGRAHGVAGKAKILDDCTIQLSSFEFDGAGVDVRFYAGLGGKYAQGFSLSARDLRRPIPYAKETVFAQLPEDRSLDEMDGLSVWCVPVGVSFGEGSFSP